MVQPMQETDFKDVRELVGYPRTPIRKVSTANRALLKKTLETGMDIDPVIGIRASLALGMPLKAEWLRAGLLDQALNAADLAKHLDKLVTVKRMLNAVEVGEAIQKRLDRASAVKILSALRKVIVPKRTGKTQPEVVLDEQSALAAIRITLSLASILLGRESHGAKKRTPEEIAELISAVIQGCATAKVAMAALEFSRVFEKQVGWSALERPILRDMTEAILGATVKVGYELLRTGAVAELEYLASRVTISEFAESKFRKSIAHTSEAEASTLPIASRTWSPKYLEHRDEVEPQSATETGLMLSGDAPRERLALILINSWEARNDGSEAMHAFSVAEEVCRNGFDLYLCGDLGSVTNFDPDIHETNASFRRGDACQLVRPWIEWHSPDSIQILIRARVIAVKTPSGEDNVNERP